MSQDGPGPTDAEAEAEAMLESLIDDGVLHELPDTGRIGLSEAFERAYEETARPYLTLGDERFRAVVAETFDVDPAEASERIEEFGVTRTDLATYVTLTEFLDDPPPQEDLAVLTNMVTTAVPEPVVPTTLEKLDDDSYEAFVEDRRDVALIVMKEGCGSCRVLKEDLPEIIDAAPDGLAFAGVDGDETPDLLEEFDVTAAPTTLYFADGEFATKVKGRKPVEEFLADVRTVYG